MYPINSNNYTTTNVLICIHPSYITCQSTIITWLICFVIIEHFDEFILSIRFIMSSSTINRYSIWLFIRSYISTFMVKTTLRFFGFIFATFISCYCSTFFCLIKFKIELIIILNEKKNLTPGHRIVRFRTAIKDPLDTDLSDFGQFFTII